MYWEEFIFIPGGKFWNKRALFSIRHNFSVLVKFGLSEKHTKFEKNLPYGFDKSADLLSRRQNHKADFFKLFVLFKTSEL